MVGRQALVVASAGVLVGLAVVTGLALTVNVLALLVYQQRRTFAALKAGGVSAGTLGSAVVWQALLVSLVGATLGVVATPVGVYRLNLLTEGIIGFEGLVVLEQWAPALGFGLALAIGVVGAAVAARRTAAIRPLAVLR